MRQAGAYSGILSGGGAWGKTGPHSFPLARIKKIMKKSSSSSGHDQVVKMMISGEAPIVVSKACEIFVEQITKKAWNVTLQSKRRTLHKHDVASAVISTDIFDFLVNLVSSSDDDDDDNHDHDDRDHESLSGGTTRLSSSHGVGGGGGAYVGATPYVDRER